MRKYRGIGDYLVVDPRVYFGKLTFKGTRVPVETVLTYLGKGRSIDEVLRSWPQLSRDAVSEALYLAGKALVEVCGAAPTNGSLEEPSPWRKVQRERKPPRAKAG